jgi:enoyl-CoA hydratase
MSFENVKLDIDGAVATLTISRPKALNALNAATFNDIEAAVEQVTTDESVRVLIITGDGEKSFVAGADIVEIKAIESSREAQMLALRGQAVFNKIEQMPKPAIAAINGFALGGGCELALSCDIRIAADTANLGLPEINLGIIPGYGGTQRLPRLVGKGMAKLIAFTGEMISAQEAHRIGLVEKVVPAAELMAEAGKLAAKLAKKAPIALGLLKSIINDGTEIDLERACAMEAAGFGIARSTQDCEEGTSAFLEKRKAQFKGK